LLTVAAFDDLKGELGAGQTLVPRPATVQTLRRIKDDAEIEALRRAFAIADLCVEWVAQNAKAGITEREIAWGMESFMRHTHGAERLSFPSIVACGPNSALVHGRAGDRILGSSGSPELLLTDFGCIVDSYCSDITRTFMLGEPATRHTEVYQAVLRAQQAAISAVRPGIAGKDIDTTARDILTEAGLGEAFAHSTGHGVGRNVHDHPAFSQKSDLVLEPGMVVTVEPGAYLAGWGGIRVEDVLLVTDDGHDYLTHANRDLRQIG
jgi:Xaa-Pro aminopeptidase